MRAKEVRDAIVSALEAITPDEVAHGGDVFRQAPSAMDEPPSDRTFHLERTSPQSVAGLLMAGADPYSISFDLGVTYVPTPKLEDRLLDDGDLVVDALKNLSATQTQVLKTEITGGADLEDPGGNRVVIWNINVVYDRRST